MLINIINPLSTTYIIYNYAKSLRAHHNPPNTHDCICRKQTFEITSKIMTKQTVYLTICYLFQLSYMTLGCSLQCFLRQLVQTPYKGISNPAKKMNVQLIFVDVKKTQRNFDIILPSNSLTYLRFDYAHVIVKLKYRVAM